MPGERDKPFLFGADGRPAQQQLENQPPMYQGGFQLPVRSADLPDLLRACCVPMEVAPGIMQPVAQFHADVVLCWVETLRGFQERDERIAELEDIVDAMAAVIEDMRKQLGLPEFGPAAPEEEK